jgi:hypothetical protein
VVALSRILCVVAALVNVGDIVLHVAIDQVEPLRVAGNIVVIAAAVGMLVIPALHTPVVPIMAGVVSLALNLVFIVTSGIGGLGVVLIALTTILLAVLAGSLRRPRTERHGI